MKKHFWLLSAFVAFFAVLAAPARAQTILEKIASEVMAARFGIKTSEVTRVRTLSGLSTYELAPIFSASMYGNAKADTIWQLRRDGLGWGQVAHRIGMHPGTFNKLRNTGAFDSQQIWCGTLGSRFGVPVNDIVAIQKRGANLHDTIAAILIAKSSRRSPQAVFEEYRRGRDWEAIRTKYKVDFGNWRKYAKNPPTQARLASGNPGGNGKGQPMKTKSSNKDQSPGQGKKRNSGNGSGTRRGGGAGG